MDSYYFPGFADSDANSTPPTNSAIHYEALTRTLLSNAYTTLQHLHYTTVLTLHYHTYTTLPHLHYTTTLTLHYHTYTTLLHLHYTTTLTLHYHTYTTLPHLHYTTTLTLRHTTLLPHVYLISPTTHSTILSKKHIYYYPTPAICSASTPPFTVRRVLSWVQWRSL